MPAEQWGDRRQTTQIAALLKTNAPLTLDGDAGGCRSIHAL
jgi:hypothetical protein